MSQPALPIQAFATTAPGLEPVLKHELLTHGYQQVRPGISGVSFRTDRHGLERACLVLRTAHRVLWNLGTLDASSAERLYRSARDVVRWAGFIPPTRTFVIDATARNNEALRDSRFVARVVKDAIVDAVRDAAGERPNVDFEHPDVVVRVSVSGRQGIINLDAAGTHSLHARGYRTVAGEAPLRETLAAGLLQLAEWQPQEPLVDPMCGSGTLAIEAALIGLKVAPGLVAVGCGRRFGFETWPGFRRERLDAMLAALRAESVAVPGGLRIHGSDVQAPEVRMARENADRAGVGPAVSFMRADAFHWRPAGDVPGLLVTNPPYGARLQPGGEPAEFYADFGRHLRSAAPGWRVAILAPGPREAEALGIPHLRWVNLKNGDLSIIACIGQIPA
jgi:23S rRNA G2445 N2-methylase RlmL